jgi:hypothetical protein
MKVQFAAALVLILLVARTAWPVDRYVDNEFGDDAFDGLAPLPIAALSGPTRTISRALARARSGDTIHLANHGVAYTELLSISGPRFSQGDGATLTIEGHGAIISGALPIPASAWRALGNGLWKFAPRRKAYYQLIENGGALPEVESSGDDEPLPELEPGEWCAWRGAIHYRARPDARQTPPERSLEFAALETGLTLLDARGIRVRNLTFRHFWLDGVNASDRTHDVVLENVQLLENGRCGLYGGGTSRVSLLKGVVRGNREAQVINAELARTELREITLGEETGVPFRIRGGRVFVDGEEIQEDGD